MSKEKKIIDSTLVQDYKPPAVIRKAFEEFEALRTYTMQLYNKLREIIYTKSDKRHSITEVRYNGLPIISEYEAAP